MSDIARVHPHPRYPLLYPVSQAFIYFAVGAADDWAVMLLVSIFLPFLLFFLFDLARLYLKDREKALAASALLAVIPAFFISDGSAYSGYADVPLSLMYCLSFGMTLLWKKNGNPRFLMFSAFLSAALMLTKNEGFLLLALNMLLVLLPGKLEFNLSGKKILDFLKAAVIYLAIVAAVVAPWQFLAAHIMNDNDPNSLFALRPGDLIVNLPRMQEVLDYTAKVFAGAGKNMFGRGFSWVGLWPIFVLTTILAIFYRMADQVHLSLIVLADVLIITLMYAMIELPPDVSISFAMLGNVFRIYLPMNSVVALQIVSTLKAVELRGRDLNPD